VRAIRDRAPAPAQPGFSRTRACYVRAGALGSLRQLLDRAMIILDGQHTCHALRERQGAARRSALDARTAPNVYNDTNFVPVTSRGDGDVLHGLLSTSLSTTIPTAKSWCAAASYVFVGITLREPGRGPMLIVSASKTIVTPANAQIHWPAPWSRQARHLPGRAPESA
jgi:hypothetical protein